MKINSKVNFAILTALLLVMMMPTSFVLAQGKGNGGGKNNPPPPGSVYFYHDNSVWSMNSDGSAMTRLAVSHVGFGNHPSHDRHATERWFTTQNHHEYDLPLFPNGRPYVEVGVASQSNTKVGLVAEPDLEILSPPVWLPDDQSISFVAERWNKGLLDNPTTVIQAGLYTVDIDYDTDGSIIGAIPGTLIFVTDLSGVLQIGENGFSSQSEVAGHSWSPDTLEIALGTRIRTDEFDGEQIWIINRLQSVAPQLFSDDNGAGWPEWSPDGRNIGFVSRRGTKIQDRITNKAKLIRRTPSTSWGIGHWSPDGSYLVISHWDNFSGYDGIYRFTSSAGRKTLLVDDSLCPDTNTFNNCPLITLGWRN